MRLACPGLASASSKNVSIITPTPLLAAVAAQQAAIHELSHGHDSFERTAHYSIDAWLAARWQEARYAADAPLLLSRAQERALWQSTIERNHPRLFDSHAAARLARRAATLLTEWNIPSDGDPWNDHEDAQHSHTWLKLFRRHCREQDWITRSDLWRLVPKWIQDGACSREPLVFAAFETTTPALRRLLEKLGNAARVEPAGFSQSQSKCPVKCFNTFTEELEHAARFARAAFEYNATKSIAIFVPDLSTRRATVQRVFESIFYPSSAFQDAQEERSSIFHIHSLAPLSDYPLVVNALLLLELARPHIAHADAEAILRSPFIRDAAAERSARALADLDLRKRRDLDVSLRDIEAASARCPLLTPVWPKLRTVLRNMPEEAELPAWCEFMRHLLKATGWPGDMLLSAQEQDAVEKWNETLSSLSSLGLIFDRVTYDTALAHCRRLLAVPRIETGDWLSPVQILDAEEAHALEFDSAVLTGLSDESWPPSVELSPLIPRTLQRAHQLPGSSQQDAQAIRQRFTQNLFQSASVLLATYSGHLSPIASPFVTRCDSDIPAWLGTIPLQSYPPASLDEQVDSFAPPYRGQEIARGGTNLLKAQSLCPFRAFAEFRLEARAPEDACFGFDARDRGTFVHRALQFVWQALRTQQELRSLSNDRLLVLVQNAVAQAVRDDQSSPLHELVTSAERERLENLILEWLRLERARKQPFTVETLEQERDYEVPGLRLKLRVDRIDRLANGRLLLIDYKSGKQSKKKLECPRPAEPQLLVYAAAAGPNVDGVFFGELKAREARAVGFSREKQFDCGTSVSLLRHNWHEFLEKSNQEVARIAHEFVEGYAAVDPVHHPCQYCGIKPVCRISESFPSEDQE